ncbi:FAD-dependent oxidoreductase [Sabulicella rubraurantiaca]|nr:FAD-dependent oxidoreductase [Sabulicella rubraurantiaca]
MLPRAAVIGGGLAGMGAALCLASRGWSVMLLEAGTRLGAGWSSTE